MNTFGRYFGYITKKTILRTVIFLLIGLAFVWISASSGVDASRAGIDQAGNHYDHRDTNIGEISTFLGILCFLIPIFELSEFKNRRNLDTLYFFPIKRWKMALAHYLSGLVQIIIIHAVCFFSSFAFYLIYTDYFALEYMIPYFSASLGLGIIIYSIFMFINSQANTVADGVIFSILWIYAFYTVLQFASDLSKIFYDNVLVNDSFRHPLRWSNIYDPLNNVTMIFQELIHVNHYVYDIEATLGYLCNGLQTVAIWGALGIGAIVGYFLTFIKKGAQKAGEISTTFVGYRTLIPLYCISISSRIGIGSVGMMIIVVMTIVGYVIFRRGFKFTFADIVSMVGSVLLSIILGLVI